jgi:hypothetical protein
MTIITQPRNALLKSAAGIHIAVGYVIEEMISGAVTIYEASQVDLSVYGTMLRPTAQINAVLINRWQQNGVTTYRQEWIRELRLACIDEDVVAFAASLFATPMARTVNPGNLITIGVPQIAVVVDGVWQQDPVQYPGAHNFNFAWEVPH